MDPNNFPIPPPMSFDLMVGNNYPPDHILYELCKQNINPNEIICQFDRYIKTLQERYYQSTTKHGKQAISIKLKHFREVLYEYQKQQTNLAYRQIRERVVDENGIPIQQEAYDRFVAEQRRELERIAQSRQ